MIIRFALFTALLAATCMAQVPGMFPWWDSPIAKDLNLSEEQNRQIQATVREYRPKLIQLRGNLETSEGELGDVMNEDPIDERKANEAIEKVIGARGDLARSVSQMGLKLRRILTAQQWQELQRRQPRPPMMRHGGPDRPIRRGPPVRDER